MAIYTKRSVEKVAAIRLRRIEYMTLSLKIVSTKASLRKK
jgi:hypothetical protein